MGFSIPPLQTEAALGHFDAVLHVGDMAYDMAQDNARCESLESYRRISIRKSSFSLKIYSRDNCLPPFRFGDAFMRQMQPVAGLLPYMTCPGNHENHYNFLNYKSRFTMPGAVEVSRRMFHFVSIQYPSFPFLGLSIVFHPFQIQL